MKMVSIADIAKATGYSPMTVSYALRDDLRIKSTTRDKIKLTAVKMGYEKDPDLHKWMARVRNKKTKAQQACIAYLAPYSKKSDLEAILSASKYINDVRAGLEQKLAQEGYKLETFLMFSDEYKGKKLSRVLQARGIEGVFVPASPNHLIGYDLSDSLQIEDFLIVSSQIYSKPHHLHRVSPDYSYNIKLLINELQKRGYCRPGLMLTADNAKRTSGEVVGGYYAHLSYGGISPPAPYIGDLESPTLIDWIQDERIDVLICFAAPPTQHWIQHSNPTVARLPCFTLNRSEALNTMGVNENPKMIGSIAAELLSSELIKGKARMYTCPIRIFVPGTLEL